MDEGIVMRRFTRCSIQQFLALLTHDGGCRVCEQLAELYEATPQTNRHYWLMTELFVKLHGGDVCSASRVKEGYQPHASGKPPPLGGFWASSNVAWRV